MAEYNIGTSITNELEVGDILTATHGSVKSITLPPGVYLLEVYGAQSGRHGSNIRGKGGYSKGELKLTKETTLNCYAGSEGAAADSAGGWNGGGRSGSFGGSGGGASDIRINSTSLYARVIVAGGGGGTGYSNSTGGNGGGLTGVAGVGGSVTTGKGGTQTSGGSGSGSGIFGGPTPKSGNGGGGGGGWFSGGAGAGGSSDSPGGGGSGYIHNEESFKPEGWLLNSSYYLSNGLTGTGLNAGQGIIKITILKLGGLSLKVNINKQWREGTSAFVRVGDKWRSVVSIHNKKDDGTWTE